MYNIVKQPILDNGSEFCMALRYGEPLSDITVERLKRFCKPTVEDYDELVQEIWDFKYITTISEPIHVWVQHLKESNIYITFSSLSNGKYVPYFNETLKINLEFIEIVSEENN